MNNKIYWEILTLLLATLIGSVGLAYGSRYYVNQIADPTKTCTMKTGVYVYRDGEYVCVLANRGER